MRRQIPQDPIAAAVAAVVAVLGALRLLERWGLTADDVAVIVGAVGTLGALWRGRVEASRRRAGVAELAAAKAAPAEIDAVPSSQSTDSTTRRIDELDG